MSWYIVVGVIIFIVFYSCLAHKKWKRDLGNLNSSRPILNKVGYIEKLESKGYSRDDISAVYDVIQKYIDVPDFSMYPDDDFYNTYRIDPEDYDDLITEVYNTLGRPLPAQEYFDVLNKKYRNNMRVEYVLELLRIRKL
jgi:hypothetical protein